jgi:hypothetical protein
MPLAALVHLVALDVQRGYEGTFDRWYENTHVPLMLGREGWLRAHLYRCLEGEPERLALFDLDISPAQLADGVSASPLSDESIGRHIRNYHARTYRLVHSSKANDDGPPLVNIISTDVVPGHEDAFDRWYSEVHVPEILACPGWRSARRYRSVDGDPTFLAVYELEDEKRPFASAEYESAVGWDDQVAHLRGYHGFRIYRLNHTVTPSLI